MKMLISLLLAAVMLSFAGCAATPEKVVVVPKDMERMLEKAANPQGAAPTALQERSRSPLYGLLGAPESYAPEIPSKTDKLKITVNARVDLPMAEGMPAARVKPAQFGQETVTALFRALCGDTPMYNTSLSGMTRAQLAENIKFYADKANENAGKDRDKAQRRLKSLQAELDAMPDDISKMLCDGSLREMSFSTSRPDVGRYMGVSAVEKPLAGFKEDSGMTFSVSNDFTRMDWQDESVDWGEEIGAGMVWNAGREKANGGYGYETAYSRIDDETAVPEEAADSLSLTPEAARGIAEDAVEKAGLPLICSGIYLETRNWNYLGGEGNDAPSPDHVYIVTFGTGINGVPCRYVSEANANNLKTETSFAPSWYYERIYCTVAGGGLMDFHWKAPVEVSEIITENANLLPFSKIAAIFETMLPVVCGGDAVSDPDLVSRTIAVNRAALELQRVTEPDAVECGAVIPVWCFYGTSESAYSWPDPPSFVSGEMPRAILTVNAVDGSIINIGEGY